MRGTKQGRPLLFYVVSLALAMTLPPVLLSAVITGRWVSAERDRLQSLTRELTDSARSQVDTYLAGKIAMLQALATSPAFDSGDFARIDLQSRELLELQGTNIVLRDLSGQQLVHTRRPFGSALPRTPITDAERVVVETKEPYIGDLHSSVLTGAPVIRMVVPVLRGGEAIYTLAASIYPDALSRLLLEAGLVAPHTASIADRQGRIIARADLDPSLIGKPLNGFEALTGDRGSWSGLNPNGVEVVALYHRSPLSGWTFATGIARAALDAPLYRSVAMLIGLALALGGLAFTISLFIVRTVLRSQQQVTEAAERLGSGDVVAPPRTSIREANVVGEAIAAASAKLRDQADALTSINRDLERLVRERTQEVSAQSRLLHATLDNMDQGLMVVDAAGRIPICNLRALELLDLPAELMMRQPTFEEVRRYQLERDDFAKSEASLRRWVANAGLEQTPHSYVRERPNGVVLEIRTVPMGDGSAVRTYTDITAHKQAERLAHEMARRDPLTGLPNRTLFRERLNEALADQRPGDEFALFCLDLDRFKMVNDTLGHPAGDALLQAVAERIKSLTGPRDTVARLGGDEFAIMQPGSAQPLAARVLARRLVETLSERFELGAHRVDAGVSIGVVVSPRDGRDADTLFKSADTALYRAKHEGRNTFRFYEACMDVAAQERRALELDLRSALSGGEFVLHYQPVMTAESEALCGFEALIRWNHPQRGMISPAEFIPLAEEMRLIGPIGEWVLREACREAKAWPPDVKVAVNISAAQFAEPGFVNTVLSALTAAALPPSRLQIEITETVLMEQTDRVSRVLQMLRDLGVEIALDDFGTGYSSLSYLHRFALDRIKIDRSFINGACDPTTAAIVRTITGLAARLKARITAEGVETEEQLAFARREGCTEVQGFLFSRPLPAQEARLFASKSAEQAA